MARWGLSHICFPAMGVPRGKILFLLWTDGWEREVVLNNDAKAPYQAMALLMEECLRCGCSEEVEFVGSYRKLWTELRKIQKTTVKKNDYGSQLLFELLHQFKQKVSFSSL